MISLKWLATILFSIFVVATIVAIIILYYYFSRFGNALEQSQNTYGVMGDFFGGILNPILSFISLIAILLTLTLQHHQLAISSSELKLSRQELADTRKELNRSAVAQEESGIYQQKQAKVQELTTRLSAIEMLLSIEGKPYTMQFTNGSSSSRVNIKSLTGSQTYELYNELAEIYKELSNIKNGQS